MALQFTFGGLPEAHTRAMLGENAVEVYGLDLAKLKKVAKRIDAPTIEDINEPLVMPNLDRPMSLAFRTNGLFT